MSDNAYKIEREAIGWTVDHHRYWPNKTPEWERLTYAQLDNLFDYIRKNENETERLRKIERRQNDG